MAKALLGHVGSVSDPRVTTELRTLRMRVRELEHEVELLRSANARLSEAADVLTLSVSDALSEPREPAYT